MVADIAATNRARTTRQIHYIESLIWQGSDRDIGDNIFLYFSHIRSIFLKILIR